MTILDDIKRYKLDEIRALKQRYSLHNLEEISREQSAPRGFEQALRDKLKQNKVGLIAEIKKASPSKGIIREDFNVPQIAQSYQEGGAACLSILTDSPSFKGENAFLSEGRAAVSLPVLRKDFMFDPHQIIHSRALGADCILLIMACLDPSQARELQDVAQEYQMDVLVETHNAQEIDDALTYLNSDLIGINNRNLHNFTTDIAISTQLVRMLPKEKICVSESGISSKSDIKKLQSYHINCFLIGESLMRHQDIQKATRTLLA